MFVGAFTLSLTAGLGAGVQDYITKQTDSVAIKDSLMVLPGSFGAPTNLTGVTEYDPNKNAAITNTFLTEADIEKVKKTENIRGAELLFMPKPEYVTRDGQKKYKDDYIDVFVKNLELPLAAGTLANAEAKDEMVLAYQFVEPLGFSSPSDAVGKTVKYAFKNAEGKEMMVDVKVTGVQINSLTGSQNRISSALAKEAFTYQFGTTDASQFAMAYLEPNLSESQVEEIKKKLKEIGYNAQTFEDQINTIKNFLNVLQVAVNTFALIVILAASIGIINTLLMAVYERTREIGLMKALGMKGRDVFLLFALEAASLGLWGGVIGVVVSILLGGILNSVATQTFLKGFEGFTLFIFPPAQIFLIVLGTMFIGLLAGTLPALKASKLNPIDALRYE